ncbi:hypothetical protein N7450_004853 [Penicillium hetheringtonii]|uniref:Uncharacterized protein n=1 Tax=Penicillium hetheringtonii TaxID=911720 RepID=A0AAD6GTS5_9EURO|nr:hypothetical protein N7450_004853 [Penicillium hetheringtonii]
MSLGDGAVLEQKHRDSRVGDAIILEQCQPMRIQPSFKWERRGKDHDTYHDTVIPGKDGQFVKPGDKIPPGGGIARDKDPKGEDRKGVH